MSEQDTPLDPATADEIRAESERLRANGVLGRSNMHQRVFNFLLEASLEGRAPKEIEIAEALLPPESVSDGILDGSVRVAIHRLRRRLDDHYATSGSTERRLIIPRGSYRLELVKGPHPTPRQASGDEDEGDEGTPPSRTRLRARILWPAIAALLGLIAIAGWAVAWQGSRPTEQFATAARSPLWAPLASSSRPTLIVVGDYYIFGELAETGEVQRLVREFAINSRTDLDEYLMYHPDKLGRFQDMQLSYLPTGAASALRNVVPLVDANRRDGIAEARLISMSELTPELLKSHDIVYVGLLSGLGLLRDAVFAGSRFAVGSSYDELIDEKTGRRYLADARADSPRSASRGYAYVAALPGPAGNHVVVISGSRDTALMEAAELAADPAQMATAAKDRGNAFEALYAVGALGNVNVNARLVVADGIATRGIWSSANSGGTFPDQLTGPEN